jgi:uncharacterized membrane protein
MSKKYPVYKGLQKPFIYKGFKGKFIYWGVGSLLAGLIIGALTMAIVNMWAGVLVLASIVAAGLLYTLSKQKGGLNEKTRNRQIIYYPVSLKIRRRYG